MLALRSVMVKDNIIDDDSNDSVGAPNLDKKSSACTCSLTQKTQKAIYNLSLIHI